jgi:hypothetical protein
MEIKRGIMLYNQSGEGYDCISINSGVEHYTNQDTSRVSYGDLSCFPSFEEDAFVTKRNWRHLHDREIRIMAANRQCGEANTIYLGDIPENLKRLFQQLALEECRDRKEVFEKFRSRPELTVAINQATDNFLRSKSNGKPFRFHYLGSNLPNLRVVACDTTVMAANYREEDKKYMGMHNDGTRDVSPHRIHTLGNRLTINLGKETRSFLFMNLTMTQAFNMLAKKMDTSEHKIDIVNIARYFFMHFPDYPVIKINQKPYQYYIAPTDNCFHDGSTEGMTALDIIIVYFGAFTCQLG